MKEREGMRMEIGEQERRDGNEMVMKPTFRPVLRRLDSVKPTFRPVFRRLDSVKVDKIDSE